MRANARKEADRWLRQARQDVSDARYAAAGARYHLVCFLAQQAAEKSIKAFLYATGQEDVWGHSVADLCVEAGELDPAFTELKTSAGPLDKFYIPTRYPDALPGGIPAEAFTAGDSEFALAAAERALEVVAERIAALPPRP